MTLTLTFEVRKDIPWCDRILAGCALIRAYEPDATFEAQHDQLWFGEYKRTYEQMTAGEREAMEAWGWHEDSDGWSHFT